MKLATKILIIDMIRRYKREFHKHEEIENCFELDLLTFKDGNIKIQFQFRECAEYVQIKPHGKIKLNKVGSSCWARIWKDGQLIYHNTHQSEAKYIALNNAIKFIRTL